MKKKWKIRWPSRKPKAIESVKSEPVVEQVEDSTGKKIKPVKEPVKETKKETKKDAKPIKDWRKVYGKNNVYIIPSPIAKEDGPILMVVYNPTVDQRGQWTIHVMGFRKIKADGYLADHDRIMLLAENHLENLLRKLSML